MNKKTVVRNTSVNEVESTSAEQYVALLLSTNPSPAPVPAAPTLAELLEQQKAIIPQCQQLMKDYIATYSATQNADAEHQVHEARANEAWQHARELGRQADKLQVALRAAMETRRELHYAIRKLEQ